MREWWVLIAGLALPLGSCGTANFGPPAPNFCKAENRQIPDAELMGRLLLSVRKKSYFVGRNLINGLPDYMERYLATELPRSASEYEVRLALTRFVSLHPLCCQINLEEVRRNNNPEFNEAMREGRGEATVYYRTLVEKGYFGNLYVLPLPFHKNDKGFAEMVESKSYNVELIAAAFNCGNAFIIHPSD